MAAGSRSGEALLSTVVRRRDVWTGELAATDRRSDGRTDVASDFLFRLPDGARAIIGPARRLAWSLYVPRAAGVDFR